MAKETFKIHESKNKDETEFSEKGTVILRKIWLKAVDEDSGIVLDLKIKGPVKAIKKKFIQFPMGTGADLEIVIQTITSPSITSNIVDKIDEEEEEKKQTEADLEKELQAITEEE